MEVNERFLHISLYQGIPKKDISSTIRTIKEEQDPVIICTSFKRKRFYIFSRPEPEEQQTKRESSRAILNEQPVQNQTQAPHNVPKVLSTQVYLLPNSRQFYIHQWVKSI